VFRSRDGGRSWQHVLFRDAESGAIDLSIDPSNPRVVYAACWQAIRRPHELVSGGPGSGLFRSSDGGDSWEELTRKPGLPTGVLGKIGVVASPARAGRVWAIVEAEDGAVFRSDDYGESWTRLSEDRELRQRAWYYMHIYADPRDAETVWVLNLRAWKSIDGGKSFIQMPIPHGDHHDLWIDPNNSNRMIEGNDGGATVSLNGGRTWSNIYNQPTAEFYHVTTDNQVPYRVYGAQQDNTTISVASRSNLAGITRSDWFDIGGGESGYIAVDPRKPNIIYAGSYGGFLTRYDHTTGQRQNINVWPEASLGWGANQLKYRFQWTYPTMLSPHDPKVLYVTSNHVHRSTDEGMSWEVLSPDLTRNDKTRQEPSGGPITRDNTGAEYYDTLFAFAESPVQPGLLWAGADDGLVHVSRDGGASWQDVTPPAALLPDWALISIIEPSPHDPATAYLAATRYKHDDFRPYLLKTADYGASWQVITGGIPADDFSRVIREDPVRRGLLYAGTETGLYLSFDDGGHWQRLGGNLPVVPIHDLVVKDDDLVLATHGRSFWILDDISPLQQMASARAQLFAPRPTIRFYTNRGFGRATGPGNNYQGTGASMITYRMVDRPDGTKKEVLVDAGQNPPDGVLVNYFLATEPDEEITLTFLDAADNEIKTFSSRPKGNGDKKEPAVPAKAGLNRFVWNMRYPEGVTVPGAMFRSGGVDGPTAPPGSYTVQLTVGSESFTQLFEIRKDPRLPASDDDLQAQFQLLLEIRDKLSDAHGAVNRIRKLRPQVEEWQRRGEAADHAPIAETAQSIAETLTTIENVLIEPRLQVPKDPLHFPPKLNAKLAALVGVVSSADARPTRQSYEVYEKLAGEIDAQLDALAAVVETDVPRLNGLVRQAALPAVP
ncbi:MAG TPA: glycosyl hydrolase, partial [Thermomicrobiaceae bacterium]|nr:glycosyl hydrolase [Thermomicrobiaceae bacterium]